MRAAVYDEFGGADKLTVREVEDPPVGPDTVLVRVKATSVNPVDWKIREGYLQGAYPHHLPIIPGWDVAGVVEAVGPAVRTGLQVGDEVFGYVRRDDVAFGTTAELVPAPERTVTRKPTSLSFTEAGAVPLAGLTAYQLLTESVQIQKGERVLVHAAAGGVGHLAVQIATALGAEVVATASSGNHDFLRELGADELIDYTATDFRAAVTGVDVVLDLVGGAYGPRSLDVLRPGGLLIGASIDPGTDEQRAAARGLRYVWVTAEPSGEVLERITERIAAGRLRVAVQETYPLAEAAEAHRAIEAKRTTGKIVLVP